MLVETRLQLVGHLFQGTLLVSVLQQTYCISQKEIIDSKAIPLNNMDKFMEV